MAWLFLLIAAGFEVTFAMGMKYAEGFTRLWPSVITVVGYVIAFWLLSYPLRVMPTGIVYAIWSGMGIVLISAVAWIWYRQTLDLAALIGRARLAVPADAFHVVVEHQAVARGIEEVRGIVDAGIEFRGHCLGEAHALLLKERDRFAELAVAADLHAH